MIPHSFEVLLVCFKPDITFFANKLCRFMGTTTNTHWLATKLILCYLKGTLSHSLSFTKSSLLYLVVFSDAD